MSDLSKFQIITGKVFYVLDDEGNKMTLGEARVKYCPYLNEKTLRYRIHRGDTWDKCIRPIDPMKAKKKYSRPISDDYIVDCLEKFGNTVISVDRHTKGEIAKILEGYDYKLRYVEDREFGRPFYVVSI